MKLNLYKYPFISVCFLSFVFICFAMWGVSCSDKSDDSSTCQEILYTPKYSKGFEIKQSNDSLSRLITVYNPWQGADNVAASLLIDSDNSDKKNSKAASIKDKAERIVCMSSTHIAMLDALGAIDKVVAVSGKQYISNPYIHSHSIPDIGYEGNIDYETLLSVKPDLVLLFSVNGVSGMENKLREFGIPFLYVGDYVEEDPLGKAEWIIPIAEVVGVREKGIEKFKDIEQKYNNLKELVAQNEMERPAVMVNAPFADSWFMPSSQSYVAKMIEDAGGDYIYEKNTGNSSMPIDMEEALTLVSNANFWINIGDMKSKDEIISTFPKFANAKCIETGNLFNNNLRSSSGGGNDCYESGVMNPDLILRDLVKIFHPSLVEEDFTYYQQLK